MLVNYKHYCSITLENSNNFLMKYEEKFNIFYKKFIFSKVMLRSEEHTSELQSH